VLSLCLRYWHTLRHLRPVQFYGRLWFRFHHPRLDETGLGSIKTRHSKGGVSGEYYISARDAPAVFPELRQPSLLAGNRFRFLNETHDFVDAGTWNDPAIDKLWLYNLHYFDDLNAKNSEERFEWHCSLVKRWISENPVGQGNGWEPYPTSLRIVNWIKWSLRFESREMTAFHWGSFHQSLALQARWLCRRLEFHLLGNHLFANAKALVFAGAFFEGDEAKTWLQTGSQLLTRELKEQVLPDGGHFERSPMYHSILLEDVLDVIRLGQICPKVLDDTLLELCSEKARAMLQWLEQMTHPDGEISFFNDAAFGVAPNLSDLKSYATSVQSVPPELSDVQTDRVSLRYWRLRNTGYVRLESSSAVALLDCAPIGPDYLPGHAHADTLSFELSLFGQRVFVNGGTSEYGTGAVRLLERATAAHNTVEVNGENSSEVWGGFRVARRAYPIDLDINESDGHVIVTCAHDGYRRLRGKPAHRRKWDFSDQVLVVEDFVEGEFDTAFAYFHLHPAVTVSQSESDPSSAFSFWYLRVQTGHRVVVTVEKGAAQLVDSHYSPEFGKRLKTQCLKVALAKAGNNESDEGRASDNVGRYAGRSAVRISWGV
jgi:uncharacterized heparinase superfamily protein